MNLRIATIPGDGIGPDVVRKAVLSFEAAGGKVMVGARAAGTAVADAIACATGGRP